MTDWNLFFKLAARMASRMVALSTSKKGKRGKSSIEDKHGKKVSIEK